MADTVHKSLLGCTGQHGLGVGVCGRHVPPALRQHRGKDFSIHQRGEMSPLLGQSHGRPTLLWRLVSIANPPQDTRQPDQALHPWIMGTAEELGGGLPCIGEAQAALQVCTGCHELATKEGHRSHGRISCLQEARVGLAVCQMEQLLG